MSDEEYNKLPNTYRAYKIRVGENVPFDAVFYSSSMQIQNMGRIPFPMSRSTVDVKCLQEVVEALCAGLVSWKKAVQRVEDTGLELHWMSQQERMMEALMEIDCSNVQQTMECL